MDKVQFQNHRFPSKTCRRKIILTDKGGLRVCVEFFFLPLRVLTNLNTPYSSQNLWGEFCKGSQTKQELARPKVTTWAREEEEEDAAFMKALINPPTTQSPSLKLAQIPILNSWLIFSLNMYELFPGNIWHSLMISVREDDGGPCVWKGNRNGCFGKFYIVVNCSHCSLRPVLLDFTLWNSPVSFLHEFVQIGWMGLQYVCKIFNHLLTLGDKLMTNIRCTFFSEHIFPLKQCALKHEFLKLWRTTSTRRKKNQTNSSTLNSSNKWWPFTILKFPLQEKILRKRLCQRLNLTGRSYSLAGEVQLVCGSGRWEGGRCNRSPDSQLPPNSHGRSTKTSPGNHQQLLRLFSLLARTKISRRNVETFFARHLLIHLTIK